MDHRGDNVTVQPKNQEAILGQNLGMDSNALFETCPREEGNTRRKIGDSLGENHPEIAAGQMEATGLDRSPFLLGQKVVELTSEVAGIDWVPETQKKIEYQIRSMCWPRLT